jgi:hypothetical protein
VIFSLNIHSNIFEVRGSRIYRLSIACYDGGIGFPLFFCIARVPSETLQPYRGPRAVMICSRDSSVFTSHRVLEGGRELWGFACDIWIVLAVCP